VRRLAGSALNIVKAGKSRLPAHPEIEEAVRLPQGYGMVGAIGCHGLGVTVRVRAEKKAIALILPLSWPRRIFFHCPRARFWQIWCGTSGRGVSSAPVHFYRRSGGDRARKAERPSVPRKWEELKWEELTY
jgi:hypothetical protein